MGKTRFPRVVVVVVALVVNNDNGVATLFSSILLLWMRAWMFQSAVRGRDTTVSLLVLQEKAKC